MSSPPEAVVGVLYKYVNALQGWRPRLVVLEPFSSRLTYYHVIGPSAVRVSWVEEQLRSRWDVVEVGVQVGVLKKKEDAGKGDGGELGASGEVFMMRDAGDDVRVKVVEVCSVRESGQDDRKLWVNERLELRAESQDDRWVWMHALRAAMEGTGRGLARGAEMENRESRLGGLSRLGREKPTDGGLPIGEGGAMSAITTTETTGTVGTTTTKTTLDGVERALRGFGVKGEAFAYVRRLAEELETEYDKRRLLLEIVYRLEDEKRELETRLAVECVREDGELDEDGTVGDSGSTVADEDGSEDTGNGESEDEFYDATEELSCEMERSGSLGDLERFSMLSRGGEGARPGSTGSTGIAATWANGLQEDRLQAKQQTSTGIRREHTGKTRARLPTPQEQERAISLWSLIKEMVGKDLTRVCLPVYFNEPLSALELTAEDLEYSELLDIAASHPPGSMERLVNIMAFAISPYSSTEGRTSKPFNPLLGETYELCSEEKGFRFIAEKVSHHPTIIAAHATGNKWTYQGDAEIKSKFWGRSIELKPEGVLTLDFEDGDSYSWNKVTTSINNLIIGKIYVDHGGMMKIHRRGKTGTTGPTVAKVRFKETKMLFDRDPRRVEGYVEVAGVKMPYPILEGHWNESLDVIWKDGQRERVWTRNPMPEPENRNRYVFRRYPTQ